MTRWWKIALFCSIAATMSACDDGDDPPVDGGGDPEVDSGPRRDGGGGGDCEAEGEIIDADITADTTWDCPLYVLNDRIFVEEGATLTIAPGTTVLGEVGGAVTTALIITRGAELVANGTEADPIVFTSGSPDGERATGDWAGVVLLGSASTNDGACVDDGVPTTEDVCDAP